MKNKIRRYVGKEEIFRFSITPRVGILLGEKANPFWSELKHHFKRSALEMGFKVRFFWPSPAGDTQRQLKVFWHMLTLQFDLIIINPLSRDNLVPGIIEACKQEIPVLDVGAKTDQELIPRGKHYYFPVRTVDFYLQGVLGANYIIREIKDCKNKRVAIFEGRREATQSQGRTQGAVDTFAKAKSIHLIAREPADFERRKAKKLAGHLLTENPGVDAFFCANDLMALGVAEAIRTLRGKQDSIIVGVDLIQEAREAIRTDLIDASVAFSTASVAQAVLESAQKVLAGQPISEGYLVKSALVDRELLGSWEERNPAI